MMDIRSNEPYSLIVNALEKSYPSLQNSISTEILIIGGGITGALIAHRLLRDGKKVVMVEKRDVCKGSTAASTSMLQYEIDIPLHKLIDQVGLTPAVSSYQNCEKAIKDLKKIVNLIKSDCGFKYQKSIYFTSTKKDVSFLKTEFEVRKNHDFDVKWLTKQDLEALGLSGFAGIESASGARMDGYKFTMDLLEYLNKKGLEVYDRTEIESIKQLDKRFIAKSKDGFTIDAHEVVHCTGYESTKTLDMNIVNLKSTFAMASEEFETLPGTFKNTMFWNTDSPYLYFRGTDTNRIIMGGGDRNFKNPKLRDALLPKKEKELAKAFKKCFPEIPFKIDYSWAGTFGETKDGLPYFGKEKLNSNEHYILGFGGNGITFSVMGMDAIIHSINNKPHPYLEYYKFDR